MKNGFKDRYEFRRVVRAIKRAYPNPHDAIQALANIRRIYVGRPNPAANAEAWAREQAVRP